MLIAWAALALAGCGTGTGPDTGMDAAPDVPDDAGTEAEVPPDTPRPALVLDEPLRIAWTVQERQAASHQDLRVGDPRDPDRTKDVSLNAKLQAVDPALGCDGGCLASADLRRLAVVTGTGAQGATVQPFSLDADLAPTAVGEPLASVRSFQFQGTTLWVSTVRQNCPSDQGLSRPCFDVRRVPLDPPGAPETMLTFPPPEVLYKSQFTGHFVVSADGQTVALLNPTAGSQQLWVWRPGTGPAPVGEPVCDSTRIDDLSGKEVCSEGGGTFSDTDPLALSADGRHAVWAVLWQNRELRLVHDDLVAGTRDHLVLASAPSNFRKNACYNRTWQFLEVVPPIRLSADGATAFLVGQAQCGAAPRKAWTNLVSLPLASIAGGRAAAREDFRWATAFPEEFSPRCVTIQPSSLDLSPSGTFAAFVATPRFQSDGTPIPDDPDAATAHTGDAEVWMARLDGSQEPGQITSAYETRSLSVQFAPAP